MSRGIRWWLVPLAASLLATGCAAPSTSLRSGTPAATTSVAEPSAGFTLEFHVPRQRLLDQLVADGYTCTEQTDGAGSSFLLCTYPGGDATQGIMAGGTADDLGAVSLVTDDQEILASFLAYAGSEISDWIGDQLPISVPDDGIDACKTFSQAVVYLSASPGAQPGDPARVRITLTARDWSGLSCTVSPIPAGSHSVDLFELTIQFTVDEGWSMAEDTTWTVALLRDHGALRIERYGGQVIADRCTTPVTRQSQPTVEALVAWLSAYPGLTVEEEAAVTVGGFPARVVDVVARGLPKCANEKNAGAALWVPDTTDDGIDPTEGAETLAEGDMIHVVLIEHPDAILILTIVAGDRRSADATQHLIDLSEPVIRSIVFPD